MAKVKAHSKKVEAADIDSEVDAVEDISDAYPETQAPVKQKAGKQSTDPNRIVKVNVPVRIRINDQEYYGPCEMPAHVAESLIPMISRKMKSDMKVFTGKSNLVNRLVDGTLVIKEGDLVSELNKS